MADPGNAVGAPDGNVATVFSLLGIPSFVLDMGAGEEGTGDLRVHYGGLSVGAVTAVDFLRADGSLISSGQLNLVDLRSGVQRRPMRERRSRIASSACAACYF